MELWKLFEIISRRIWIVLITMAVTLAIVVLYLFFVKPTYEADMTLRVASSSIATGDFNEFLYAGRILNTYGEIASSAAVRSELMKRLSLNDPPVLDVRVLPETELIKVKVTANNPVMAANIATTLANILIEQSQLYYFGGRLSPQDVLGQQMQQVTSELQQAQKDYNALAAQPAPDERALAVAKQVVDEKEKNYIDVLRQYDQGRVKQAISSNIVSVMDPPQVPRAPIRPKPTLDLLLGGLVGLTAGLGLALLRENIDPRLYTPQQIEAVTGLHSLAEIPKAGKNERYRAFIGNPPPVDGFRSVRISLMSNHKAHPIKTVLVTSAKKGEGKSTVLANLAYTIAQSGKSVVMVDGNLRNPTLHTVFNSKNDVGLSNLLKHNLAPERVITTTPIPEISIISAGPDDFNPASLLDSESMQKLLQDLRGHFDIVLVDSPAILSEIDASIIAPFVDIVLLVVDSEQANRDELLKAYKSLSTVQPNIIGMVVNNTAARRS